jgi:hypothetical protein
MEQLGQYLVKPAVVGGIAAVATNFLHPNIDLSTKVGSYPLGMVMFGAAAAGSIFSDLSHDYIIPHIPIVGGKLTDGTASLVAVGSSYAAVSASLYAANPASLADIGMLQLLMVSAGSELGGDYLYKTWIRPFMSN